jgi:cytoskeletal protein RodZ
MARDAGLRRISGITRAMVAGVVALSGALAVIAANGFHGHTYSNNAAQSQTARTQTPQTQTLQTQTPQTQTPQTQTPQTQTPASSSPSSALQPSSQPPVQTAAAPVVVSGGS